MENREILAAYAYRYQGGWHRIRSAVMQNETPCRYIIKEKYITVLDKEYPACLLQLKYPPWILFYEGDISLLNMPAVTIVGSRVTDAYGMRCAALASEILSKEYALVSGLAKGIDACVHETALKHGKTIAVIGSGLGTKYPKENTYLYEKIRRNGLILSEYPYSVGVRKEHFPWRNRILAALGEKLIVCEGKERSGTMLTVNEALELNKDVYCFPYPFEYENGTGCNRLIAEGAMILYERSQLTDMLHCR